MYVAVCDCVCQSGTLNWTHVTFCCSASCSAEEVIVDFDVSCKLREHQRIGVARPKRMVLGLMKGPRSRCHIAHSGGES